MASDAPYRTAFWAKATPYGTRGPERIHLLSHHLADVGATMEALLRQPTIRHRVASAGGLDDLPESTIARLAVFAALHDIGKANVGFQCRIWPRVDGASLPPRVGHTVDLAPVLTGLDLEAAIWFYDAIGWGVITTWDDRGGEVASDMLVATLSHHGDPIALEGARLANPAAWRAFGSIDPAAEIPAIGRAVREWFPAAWDPAAPPLPPAPAFQHMFLGLCTLADWIGSNTEWFPFSSGSDPAYIDRSRKQAARALRDIGLDIEEQRAIEGAAPARDFRALFDVAAPRPVQEHAVGALAERLMLIEAETGSGKTEAALWRFRELYRERRVDGAYFALPTRAAAKQLHERTRRFAQRAFESDIDVVLAVPGYESRAPGLDPSRYADGSPVLPWATEAPKRFLARPARRRHHRPGAAGRATRPPRPPALVLPRPQPADRRRGSRVRHLHARYPRRDPANAPGRRRLRTAPFRDSRRGVALLLAWRGRAAARSSDRCPLPSRLGAGRRGDGAPGVAREARHGRRQARYG